MKKSDLINGTIVVFRHGGESLVVDNNLISRDFNFSRTLDDFNEDLTNKVNSLHDIVKIVKIGTPNHILWERKEIDWSKVPVDTKVLVRNSENESWRKRYFAKYTDGKYVCYALGTTSWSDEKTKSMTAWNYCKLAEESKEEVTHKEVLNEFNNYCDEYYEKNKTCDGCKCQNDGYCIKSKFIDDRFTITRK